MFDAWIMTWDLLYMLFILGYEIHMGLTLHLTFGNREEDHSWGPWFKKMICWSSSGKGKPCVGYVIGFHWVLDIWLLWMNRKWKEKNSIWLFSLRGLCLYLCFISEYVDESLSVNDGILSYKSGFAFSRVEAIVVKCGRGS